MIVGRRVSAPCELLTGACSSVGQSTRLISVGSEVQVFPGPPFLTTFKSRDNHLEIQKSLARGFSLLGLSITVP
jgi:hypothetical protein